MSADAIPDSVDDGQGAKMFVFKKLSLRAQKQQYNAYLMKRLLNGLSDDEMRQMPPMASPRFGPDTSKETMLAEGTEDEIIHHIVFGMYEARRTAALRGQSQTLESAHGGFR